MKGKLPTDFFSIIFPTTEWRDGRFLPFPVPVADQVSVSDIGNYSTNSTTKKMKERRR